MARPSEGVIRMERKKATDFPQEPAAKLAWQRTLDFFDKRLRS